MQFVLSQQDPKATEKPGSTMFLTKSEWVLCEVCWCKGGFHTVWVCKLSLTSVPRAWNVRFSLCQPMQGFQCLGWWRFDVTRCWWCRERLRAEPGLTAGWWQPWCQEKGGFSSVCDHQVTDDKQKGLDTIGQLEMSVKERDESRCRSVDHLC